MTRIETLLEKRADAWVASAPEPPPLSDLVTRAVSARRSTSRSVMPALAAAIVVLIAAVSLIIVANRHDGSSTRPGSSGGLTASQRALAIQTAMRAASGSNPDAPGPIKPIANWPSYVDTVAATVLPYGQAQHALDGSFTTGGAETLVVRLTGRFAWITTGPPGSGPVTGNVITLLVSLSTGHDTDGGIEDQSPPQDLPHQTLLYQR